MIQLDTDFPLGLSTVEMAERLGVSLDPSALRILSLSLTRLSEIKGLKVGTRTCKTQSPLTKKWQVYIVNAYDEQLYYHFQQICMILEII